VANVPEFNEAQPLLDEVQGINKQALLLWAEFQHAGRANTLKMTVGLDKLDSVPIYGN
jgi:hypothetical protein